MSQESNDDQCLLCEDDNGEVLQCCDACTNPFHASCLRPKYADGFPNVPWFSEGCYQDNKRCCVVERQGRMPNWRIVGGTAAKPLSTLFVVWHCTTQNGSCSVAHCCAIDGR